MNNEIKEEVMEKVVEEAGKKAVVFMEEMPSKPVIAVVVAGAVFVVTLAAIGGKYVVTKVIEKRKGEPKPKKKLDLHWPWKKENLVSDEELEAN